jgi:hypothetical protein
MRLGGPLAAVFTTADKSEKPIHLYTTLLQEIVSFFCSPYAALFDRNAIPMVLVLQGPR